MITGLSRNKGHLIIATIGIIALTACQQGLGRFESRRITRAPASEKELGILVRGASESQMAEFLDERPQAHFRNLTPQAGLYELYGVDPVDIQKKLTNVHVSKNQWIPLSPSAPTDRLSAVFRVLQSKAAGVDSAPSQCQNGEDEPFAVIQSIAPNEDIEFKVVKRGSHVKLNSDHSESPLSAGDNLRRAWVITSPEGAREREVVRLGSTLEFDATELGAYHVALVVQDKRDVCGVRFYQFATTENQKYLGRLATKTKKTTTLDISPFEHLKILRVPEAWQVSQGAGVTIAIIDTGVNYNHRLLRNNVALNTKEIPDNKIDDDGNGLVDDYLGWDYVLEDAYPFDDVGHGSHVAGLATGAEFGVAKLAKYLPIKALGSFGGDSGTVSAAVRYAVSRKVQIINMSVGRYGDPEDEILAALNEAEAAGALVVAAAGNGDPNTGIGVDTDKMANYPSSLPNENIVAVASITPAGNLESYSNYGRTSVDVGTLGGAIGEGLKSTFLDNTQHREFISYSGTSMATPVTAGIAALVWSTQPKQTYSWVKSILVRAGSESVGLTGVIQSGRLLDALSAVNLSQASRLASAP